MTSSHIISTVALIGHVNNIQHTFKVLASKLEVIIMNQVDNLLAYPFQSSSYEEKLEIKCIGAHWPLDKNITQQAVNC
jgi:hypothetical protein